MIERVPREWEGETVVCIGTGPSLTPADVEWCRGRARVMAINDAYKLAPWADVLYAADHQWWKAHPDAQKFSGYRYGMISPIKEAESIRIPGVIHLRHGAHKGLSTDPTRLNLGMAGGNHSGYQAINLAVLFGATRILLLGYDMKWADKSNHFFGQHPAPLSNGSHYDLFIRAYMFMLKPLHDLGVEVINCTRDTALPWFRRMRLEDALMERAA